MNINIIDNAIPQKLLITCVSESEYSSNFCVLHAAGNGSYGFKFSWLIYTAKEQKFAHECFEELWEHVKGHLPKNIELHRCYVNAHTYGIEDTIHVDEADLASGLTVIVYLCLDWYPEWFGQTIFFKSTDNHHNEIIQSVIPKPNRILIFDKNIPHCVSPLSRRFAGVRLTCMYKVKLLEQKCEADTTVFFTSDKV